MNSSVHAVAIPELTARRVETLLSALCEARVPPEMRHQVRLTWDMGPSEVTLIEERPAFAKPSKWIAIPIARFRYTASRDQWALDCANQHGQWRRFDLAAPTRNFERLLTLVDQDRSGVFWG